MLKKILKENAEGLRILDTSNNHKRKYLMIIVMNQLENICEEFFPTAKNENEKKFN